MNKQKKAQVRLVSGPRGISYLKSILEKIKIGRLRGDKIDGRKRDTIYTSNSTAFLD